MNVLSKADQRGRKGPRSAIDCGVAEAGTRVAVILRLQYVNSVRLVNRTPWPVF